MSKGLILAYILVAIGYWMLVTRFTGELIAPEWLSSVYDSLGAHLTHLSAEVDQSAILWEGLQVNNKTYAYFGPFPAFIRIGLNAVFPEFSGKWSRVSCLLAAVLSVIAFGTMVFRVTAANERLSAKEREALRIALTLGFAFGTPLTYLISCARIYHEAILWGLCGAMWCVVALASLVISGEPARRSLGIFSSAAFITILSRVTFGVPVILASCAFLFAGGGRPWTINRNTLGRFFLLWPIAAALLIAAWYNSARFGSHFKFFDYGGFYLKADAIGGDFNVSRIPDTLWHYMGISARYFSSSAPFVRVATANYVRPELFMPDWREQTIPLVVASPWLIVCSVLSLATFGGLQRRGVFLIALFCFLLQTALILSFYFVTQRFAAEFLPLLSFLLVPWLWRTHGKKFLISILGVLVLWSMYATIASTLDWNMAHNGDTDLSYKRVLSGLFSQKVRLTDFSGEVVYLSDLAPTHETTSFVAVARDKNAKGEPLEVRGEPYPKGLGTHAYTKVAYAVPKGRSTFAAIVGPSLSEMNCEKMSYRMRVSDEKGGILLETEPFSSRTTPVPVEIKLGDASVIVLEVDPLQDGIDCDHANWVMAQFR